MNNVFLSAIKYVFLDLIGNLIYFPVWWYTTGTKNVLLFAGREAAALAHSLSLKILFKSLLKPMYGDYSRSGRIISFFVRIFHFFFLMVATVVWIVILSVVFIIWLSLPVFVVYSIIYQAYDIRQNYLINIFHAIFP